MTSIEGLPIEHRTIKMGEEMSVITFGELVKELTGESFEVVYKDYIAQGEPEDVKNNLE